MHKNPSEDPQPIGAPDSKFVHLVHGALAHLYDPAYLQNHPLVSMLALDINPDYVTRAQGVRRVLLECIERLRPDTKEHGGTKAARAYAILTYRYVDGLSMEEIADKLALSRRQAYREHEKGIKAVASLLWDKVQRERTDRLVPDTSPSSEGRLGAVQAEVNRLRQAGGVRESISLGEVLEGVRALLVPITQQMGAQIRMLPADAWPSVVADRVMLRQALLNLLSHALYAIKGDLAIMAPQAQGNLLIDILETFPPTNEVRPAPSSSPRPDKIGLAVAQALIEAQGGQLEVRAQNGRWGARISLPISGKMSVLVVDDNADIVALFQRYLGGLEVSVVGATDGEQAIHLAAELCPQVITLDVMMPTQDGWEILQRLKDSPETKHIPVVICSVLNEPQMAFSMGASAYVTKPISQRELLATLQRYLGPLQMAG
jgi:CheY-like chemotaxis protein